MNIQKFEKDMAAFSLGQHQDVLTYLHQLEISGWTIDDAREWTQGKKKELTSMPIRDVVFRCPDCGYPMRLLKVNFSPATQTGDGTQSVWMCTNKKCMNTIYNTESVEEILGKFRKYREERRQNGAP